MVKAGGELRDIPAIPSGKYNIIRKLTDGLINFPESGGSPGYIFIGLPSEATG